MTTWYEDFHNKCPRCREYGAIELTKYGRKYYEKKCRFCGFTRKHLISWAHYKTDEFGNTWLRTNKCPDWREVEICRFANGSMQVCEKKEAEIKRLSQMGIFG